jgi:polyhydroxybutyrate depolymerase
VSVGRCGLLVLWGALTVAVLGCSGDADGGDADGVDGPSSTSAAVTGDAVEAVPSAGCGRSTVVPGEEKVTLRSGDAERWYIRHVPPAHDGARPIPVVVDLHGYTEGADVHAVHSALGPFGDEEGFVTITPHGTGVVAMWQAAVGSPDVSFVGDLLDQVEETMCVDTARFFATGLSNGAMMTSVLACDLADRFAAVAPVAGVTAIADCDPARPVPVVAFHGTEDPFLDFEGGFGPGVANLPTPDGSGTIGEAAEAEPAAAAGPTVPEVLTAWAERNDCSEAEPAEEPLAEDVTVVEYDCPAGAEVELYRIEGGGHTWPGAEMLKAATDIVGITTFSISANEAMWDFFEDHPLKTS